MTVKKCRQHKIHVKHKKRKNKKLIFADGLKLNAVQFSPYRAILPRKLKGTPMKKTNNPPIRHAILAPFGDLHAKHRT